MLHLPMFVSFKRPPQNKIWKPIVVVVVVVVTNTITLDQARTRPTGGTLKKIHQPGT